jgi:hypothetical protein
MNATPDHVRSPDVAFELRLQIWMHGRHIWRCGFRGTGFARVKVVWFGSDVIVPGREGIGGF